MLPTLWLCGLFFAGGVLSQEHVYDSYSGEGSYSGGSSGAANWVVTDGLGPDGASGGYHSPANQKLEDARAAARRMASSHGAAPNVGGITPSAGSGANGFPVRYGLQGVGSGAHGFPLSPVLSRDVASPMAGALAAMGCSSILDPIGCIDESEYLMGRITHQQVVERTKQRGIYTATGLAGYAIVAGCAANPAACALSISVPFATSTGGSRGCGALVGCGSMNPIGVGLDTVAMVNEIEQIQRHAELQAASGAFVAGTIIIGNDGRPYRAMDVPNSGARILSPIMQLVGGETPDTTRDMLVVQLEDGSSQAFYRSTGISSDRPGQWFPFDGIRLDGEQKPVNINKYRYTGPESAQPRFGPHGAVSAALDGMHLPSGVPVAAPHINYVLDAYGALKPIFQHGSYLDEGLDGRNRRLQIDRVLNGFRR